MSHSHVVSLTPTWLPLLESLISPSQQPSSPLASSPWFVELSVTFTKGTQYSEAIPSSSSSSPFLPLGLQSSRWSLMTCMLLTCTSEGYQTVLQLSTCNKARVIWWTHGAILILEEGKERGGFMKATSEHYPIISMLFHNTNGFTFYWEREFFPSPLGNDFIESIRTKKMAASFQQRQGSESLTGLV